MNYRSFWSAMRRSALAVLLASLPVVAASDGPREADKEQEKVIAEIRRLGGEVAFDEKAPGKPVVDVFLDGTKLTDAGLAHLNELTRLRVLDLTDTQVTDAGLAHLTGLKGLQRLHLTGTKVTDAGLAHLTNLKRLTHLYLCDTGVTDAGLAHLKRLTGLQRLDLIGTKVTEAGVADLRKALPKVKIVR
jgi:hypothetical protein